MEVPSNNFSPTCEAATLDFDKYSIAPEEYVCTACPRGYAGSHCERCANGFFGNPLKLGEFCKPCDCSGNANLYAANWCDHRTGECLQCLGNTGGWKCDQCLEEFWGNAFSGKCRPCECNEFGSNSPRCDAATGQCLCKEKYVGRTCSACRDGFGNLKAGCRRCDCDPTGSTETDFCDAESGQCRCKPGVGGLTCDRCLPNHYGFGANGCTACQCHEHGAVESQCGAQSGQCLCHPNVRNRNCAQCEFGYWNIDSGSGCESCDCDPMGSLGENCNDVDGQCRCKAGVGGPKCDACLVNYWGFSSSGCQRCQPCERPGHICDPDTGRCVCPPRTVGRQCQACQEGAWDYHSYRGCKACNCHPKGSVSRQCDELTGLCRCLEGFEGDFCDRCAPGYYNFPKCRPCNCHPGGTMQDQCERDTCHCDRFGACQCKEHAVGKKCASCRAGTFGLSRANEKGCFECFCFGRSRSCRQGDHVWTQLAFSGQRRLTLSRGNTRLNISHGLAVIPGQAPGEVKVGVESVFTTPLYWSLPEVFLGDKIHSYNGYLRFSTWSNGRRPYSPEIISEYPLVQIRGNYRIILEHFPRKNINLGGRYEVRIHEDDWVVKESRMPVTREMLMIALQGVQQILIRFSDSTEATQATLEAVTLDVGKIIDAVSLRPAIGVEVCDCPPEYDSTSCQDPGLGFYRWYKEHFVTSEIIIDLVGGVKRCNCNGRTNQCDPETGECLECGENTSGFHCNVCAVGFFGDPQVGCEPCQCPTAERNFARTCSVSSSGEFVCQCKLGYTGPKCDRCDYGYYGSPMSNVSTF